MSHAPAPNPELQSLALWVMARLREPSTEWIPTTPAARELPHPVNLPGMHKAVAALIARYWFMPAEWHSDVLQDFMGCWLLRPQSAMTISRSALSGLQRGQATSVQAGIAWKLRLELLSQAHRAYTRTRREAARRRVLAELARQYAPIARGAACEGFHAY